MANSDFNLDMDNYIKKIRKKRTDPIDYSKGKAKVNNKTKEVDLNTIPDNEIVIEEKEEKGFKKFLISIFKRNKDTNELELEETVEEDIATKDANDVLNEVEEELDEEMVELEKESKGIFKKIMSWFNKKDFVEDYVDQELIDEDLKRKSEEKPTVLLSDVKESFKAINNWLNKLDAETKAEFKASEDFKKYKKFLDKYKLIKN
jgi:hypothetical protein